MSGELTRGIYGALWPLNISFAGIRVLNEVASKVEINKTYAAFSQKPDGTVRAIQRK